MNRFVEDDDSRLRFSNGSPLSSYLELMRLPNVFTAMADVAMGFLFVQQADWRWRPWHDSWTLMLLIAASSLLYVAGIVLNDVFDLELDRRERPERPIPSGRISLAAVRRLGWNLLLLGVAMGVGAGFFTGHWRPGAVAAVLAACIVLYDSLLKRTPIGPPAMGACRMFNVLLGMSAVHGPWHVEHWLVAGGIGVYVAGITWFARKEAEESRRLPLTLAMLVMMLGIAMLACFPRWSDHTIVRLVKATDLRIEFPWGQWLLLIGALGLLILWRCLRAIAEPAPGRVRMAVTQGILSIVMLDAVACYAVRDVPWAYAVLLFLLPAMFLGRWIETT